MKDKNDLTEEMINKYRTKFGCKSTEICWCEICTSIEKIVLDTLEYAKNKLDE